MAAKKTPAKTAATKGSGASWTAAPCFICSGMITDGKQAVRVQRLDYGADRKWYSWAHRGCWR
jgi:hypothetical protein